MHSPVDFVIDRMCKRSRSPWRDLLTEMVHSLFIEKDKTILEIVSDIVVPL